MVGDRPEVVTAQNRLRICAVTLEKVSREMANQCPTCGGVLAHDSWCDDPTDLSPTHQEDCAYRTIEPSPLLEAAMGTPSCDCAISNLYVGRHVYLDGKPATISRAPSTDQFSSVRFLLVQALDGSSSIEYSQSAVARIMARGGHFYS